MFLIVGLGNPGEEYEHTRHNAGFDAVDLIAEEVGARYWKTECGALTTKGVYRDHDLVLAKPQSYMNTSGGPVKQLMNAYGVDAEHLIVVHDELDIDPGTVRVKFGGGHAGHNGLRSICDKLGTLFSSVLPAACAVRDAPQANAATAEVERKFLRVIFMVGCLLYIWVYFTQTVGGCQPLRAFQSGL